MNGGCPGGLPIVTPAGHLRPAGQPVVYLECGGLEVHDGRLLRVHDVRAAPLDEALERRR